MTRIGAAIVALSFLIGGCATGGSDATSGLEQAGARQAEAAVNLGEAALAQNRFAEAAGKFQQALRQDPDNVRAKLGLGEAYLGMGATDQAIATFDSQADFGEAAAAAGQGKGIALLLAGRNEQARDLLLEVVERDPSLWRAWNALGRYHDRQRQWAKAEESYRRALAVRPQAAIVHNNLGFSYLGQGRYAEAVQELERALEEDPDLGVAQTNLRLALAFQGRYAEALAGVPREELPRVLNNIGYVATILGEYERAKTFFQRALEASPSFYEPAWRNLQYLGSLQDLRAPIGR